MASNPTIIHYTSDNGRKHWRLEIGAADSFEPGIHASYSFPENEDIGSKSFVEGIIDLPSANVRRMLVDVLMRGIDMANPDGEGQAPARVPGLLEQRQSASSSVSDLLGRALNGGQA